MSSSTSASGPTDQPAPTRPQPAPVIRGADTNGKQYNSAQEMWSAELGTGDLYDPAKGWYGKSLSYWEKVPATIGGVLGGMDHVHEADIRESRAFIESIADVGRVRALDC